jgi:hypothetical protein
MVKGTHGSLLNPPFFETFYLREGVVGETVGFPTLKLILFYV